MLLARASAQVHQPPPRENLVFHVYVDPIFGDDAQALLLNPGVGSNPRPLDVHPEAVSPANKNCGGILQHAPYSFRTLTRGALPYIQTLTQTFGQGIPQKLPWTIQNVGGSGQDRYVHHVVIHCLPGLYGPGTDIDARSGLRFNDEQWFAQIPDHVSIQGTSALDTIFDARRTATAILVFGSLTGQGAVETHLESFVDGVTVRGARSNGLPQPDPYTTPNITGAGIYIGREARVRVTVSNCFLTDNAVGIAVDSDEDLDYDNRPRIVNNTIAWNTVGLWNGATHTAQQNVGWGTPVLLNNVFDTGTPYAGTLTGIAPFQGVHAQDLTVASRTVNGVPQVINLDFNAWEPALANGGGAAAANWQVPAVRPPVMALPVPRVNIAPWTNAGTNPPLPRGSLYVNDIFRNAAALVGNPDLSPHDFRLAPNVSTSPAAPAPGVLNPLVNRGIYFPPGPGPTFLTMANGVTLFRPPGVRGPGDPTGGEDYATLHAWDWDAEGFANVRVQVRPPWPNSPDFDDIDLGADELAKLIMGGTINGTRIFSTAVPGAPSVNHLRVWFLNVNNAGPYPRPAHNRLVGRDYDWWPHVQTGLNLAPGTNYTNGTPGSDRAAWTAVGARPPFMRNLECDHSPHLFVDPHPLWGYVFPPVHGSGYDVYATNPWYDATVTFFARRDNPYLYYNPPPGYSAHRSPFATGPNSFNLVYSAVLFGLIHPPGADQTLPGSWLANYLPTSQFGPIFTCTGGTQYNVNVWGLGDTGFGCPDYVTDGVTNPWRGVRINCEVGPGQSNLQTFLGVNGPVPGGGAGASSRQGSGQPLWELVTERGRRILDVLLRK